MESSDEGDEPRMPVLQLPEDTVCRILRHRLGLERESGLAVAISRQLQLCCAAFYRLLQSCECWRDVEVSLSPKVFARMTECGLNQLVVLLHLRWRLVSLLRTPAQPERVTYWGALQQLVRPAPPLAVNRGVVGWMALFWMGYCPLQLDESLALHLFEPRYRMMCQEISESGFISQALLPVANAVPPPESCFGLVCSYPEIKTSGGHAMVGGTGWILRLEDTEWQDDGTCNVKVKAIREFEVLEERERPIPGLPTAPPLNLGLVRYRDIPDPDELVAAEHRRARAGKGPAWLPEVEAGLKGPLGWLLAVVVSVLAWLAFQTIKTNEAAKHNQEQM